MISSINPGLSLSSHGLSWDQYVHLRLHVCRLGSTKEVKIIGSSLTSITFHPPAGSCEWQQTDAPVHPPVPLFLPPWLLIPESRYPRACNHLEEAHWMSLLIGCKAFWEIQLRAISRRMPGCYATRIRRPPKPRWAMMSFSMRIRARKNNNLWKSIWGAGVIAWIQCISAKGKNETGGDHEGLYRQERVIMGNEVFREGW